MLNFFQTELTKLINKKKGENVVGFVALIAVVVLFIIVINRIAPGSIQNAVQSVFDKVQSWISGNP
ncbi:hypothetical protein SAMN04244560_00301 [Thermoanaerobacter thermohydrosulfuricus]|uniref:Uncharacterized protein n=1 Tax=Thermoanaerobacter thermohydrosulfuricus TaxID=1516 RepID=A0A1G7IQ94_THETY|nr:MULTISPECIES: hypothetical protein [Thermoanaerobacter]UZQ81836.1 hypothetical protein OEI98_001575 [Thermoanaerobacter sp. RKWS2]SDF14724.1 hypothetical protein SAMN04244560_00301 [Thermoanaerobacter thermohydrosulfuricus]